MKTGKGKIHFPDGRTIETHIITVNSTLAATSFGTFLKRDGAWRWIVYDEVTLEAVE